MENFNIIEEKENSLFKRKEVKFTIDAEITPSHADARKIISEKFSTPEENIRIKNILGKFGSKTFTISTHIYTSEQDKLDTEGQSKKDAVAKPEQPAEQPVEAPTEAPVEQAPAPEIPTKEPEAPVEEKPAEPTPTPDATPEPPQSKELTNKPAEEPKEEKTE